MSTSTTSPNMGLILPTPGQEAGPQYGIDQNTSFSIVDSHNHSPGQGVQINPSGLNINADLPFNSNNATIMRSVRFNPLALVSITANDVGCLVESGVDLYYVDGNGNQIRITNGGSLAGTSGSIANLTSPASATYVSITDTFIWQSAANTAANMDVGSLLVRPLTVNGKAVTISAPIALASNYTITLPNAVGSGSNSFLTMDTSGNINNNLNLDGSSLTTSGNNIVVGPQGVQQSMLASRATGTTVSAGGVAISASSGSGSVSSASYANIPNLSVTLTTTGRPVQIAVMPFSSSGGQTGSWGVNGTPAGDVDIQLLRASSVVCIMEITESNSGTTGSILMPPPGVIAIDPVAAGTYTYTLQYKLVSGSRFNFNFLQLVAYEI